MKNERRDFLKAAGLATAALSTPGLIGASLAMAQGQDGAQGAPPSRSVMAPAPAPEDVTPATLAEAEKLTGVAYSDAERDLIIEAIGGQIDQAKAIRALKIPNDGPAPALTFDPRLPDTRMPKARWKRRESTAKLPDREEDIAFAPVTALARWIESGRLSSRKLTEIYLNRIEKYAPKLECMVTVTSELALRQADAADREIAAGRYRGSLHGMPYGAKDLFDTDGIAITWGATPYKDRVATRDAAVIERLNEAGAVLLGKTTLGALAYGELWFGGLTRNPWDTEEGSSGSSAGSGSGVAAGLMAFALGTETLGSIASPTTRNGIVGLRPTFGRVSRYGAMALCWSMDKIGAMCRSVEDTAIVLRAINGYDPRDASSIGAALDFDGTATVAGLRVGYAPQWFEDETTPGDTRKALGAAGRAGLELVEIELPDWPYQSLLAILFVEAAASMEELTLSGRDDLLRGQTRDAWPNVFRRARFIPGIDLVQADRFRRQVMAMVQDKFRGLDAIMGPGLSTPMLLITNYTGNPALTLRAGFTEAEARRPEFIEQQMYGAPASGRKYKVPVSLTLWGPLFEDGKICRIGMALEKELSVQHLRPPLDA